MEQEVANSVSANLKYLLAFAAIVAIVGGLLLVHATLKRKEQGFGPNSTRVVGIVLFLPFLVLLATAIDFKSEVLAALLGTVAGYILSRSTDKDN